MVDILQQSLGVALAHFYPFGGRLKWLRKLPNYEDEYAIDCNNEGNFQRAIHLNKRIAPQREFFSGVPFVVASANGPLSEAIKDIKQPESFPPGLTSAPSPNIMV